MQCVAKTILNITDIDISICPVEFVCMKRTLGGHFGGMIAVVGVFCCGNQEMSLFVP